MKRRASAGFAAIALLMSAPALRAQSTAMVEVDSTRVTVGDRITMTVTVDHPEGATVTWPDSLDVAPFELLESARFHYLPQHLLSQHTARTNVDALQCSKQAWLTRIAGIKCDSTDAADRMARALCNYCEERSRRRGKHARE